MKQARILAWLLTGMAVAGAARADEPRSQPLDGFVANSGQVDREVLFYRAGSFGAVYLTRDAVVLEIIGAVDRVEPSRDAHQARARELRERRATRRHALRVVFDGSTSSPVVEGSGLVPTRLRFLLDRARPAVDVHAYAAVLYRELWPGVDLEITNRGGELAYRLLAQADADLSRVRFRYEGADRIGRTTDADLLETPEAVVSVDRPLAIGREGSIRLSTRPSGEVADAPREARAQTADRLGFSSFLGGGRDDAIYALAVDSDGQVVAVGATRSLDFPATSGALEPTHRGSFDAFASRFTADGTTLLWSTFLGGTADDRAWAVAIDGTGRPVIAGVTGSSDFPVIAGAYDESHNGSYDAFVACLAADGSALAWSTLLGGAGSEWDVSGLGLDALGRVTVVGSTRSADFPASPGAYDATLDGAQDAFVARLSSSGAVLEFATLLGGGGLEVAEDVVLDASGRAWVAGRTWSSDFPATPGVLQEALAGTPDEPDAFLARLAPGGDALEMATFLGGSLDDEAFAVALDPDGRPVVTGSTGSIDFPTTPGAYSRTYAGDRDAFVARIEADGTALVWSTLLGGGGGERGLDLALTERGHPVVSGYTCSADFPVAGSAFDDTFRGPCDAFVTSLGRNGSHLTHSTFVGGWYDESAYGLGLDALDRAVVSGETLSSDFPVTSGAYDPDHGSPDEWYDGFLLRLAPQVFCATVSGAGVPELTLTKATGPSCPPGEPGGQSIDLVEGRLEDLGAGGTGELDPVRCSSSDVVFATDTVPEPGRALFLLARYAPSGTYADGAGTGLVGARVPGVGDCP